MGPNPTRLNPILNINYLSQVHRIDESVSAGNLRITRNQLTGRIERTQVGNVTEVYTYNGFGEVETFSAYYQGALLLREEYSRDRLGRVISKQSTEGQERRREDYEYDITGRLKKVRSSESSAAVEFDYDSNNNKIAHKKANGETVQATYDAQDRILSYGALSFTHSENGDMSTRHDPSVSRTIRYTYDTFGNLKQVSSDSTHRISYLVDGFNRRVARHINDQLDRIYVYQSQLQPVAELDGQGRLLSRFVYAVKEQVPDLIIKPEGTYKVISDHLGSPRLIVNSTSGEIVQRLRHDPFGRVVTDSNPGYQPFGFAGGLYDPQTGLVRFGARDYDPEIGRWTSKDPILFKGRDTNLSGYVMNDPINYIDPNGLWAVIIGGGFSGVAGGGFEGSGGIYFGQAPGGGYDFGFFGSGGSGFGASVGVDVFGGYFPGDTGTISGPTTNFNVGVGPLTYSNFTDQNTCLSVGKSVGVGFSTPFVGSSATLSNTGTFGYRDLLRLIGVGAD